jgi:hypothetical protein
MPAFVAAVDDLAAAQVRSAASLGQTILKRSNTVSI